MSEKELEKKISADTEIIKPVKKEEKVKEKPAAKKEEKQEIKVVKAEPIKEKQELKEVKEVKKEVKEEKKTEKKAEGKEKKEEKKEEKGEKKETKEKKEVKKKKVYVKPKPIKISKSIDVKKLVKLIQKKSHPVFRGRFGQRDIRRKSNDKWDRWRKPRGIDIRFLNDDGAIPKNGFRTSKKIRFLHPSGLKEIMVLKKNDLDKVKENQAVRLSGKLGRKKRIEIIEKAREKNIYIVNIK
ncbi:MAG: eL32 family ribosomal protein [archaeon]